MNSAPMKIITGGVRQWRSSFHGIDVAMNMDTLFMAASAEAKKSFGRNPKGQNHYSRRKGQ
jgi:hypothetical protein